MAFDVKSVWAGALTSSSVRVIADTAPPTNGSLLVADNVGMTGAVTIGPVTATSEGILAFTVTGLKANTQYWYVVDAGGLNTSYKGTFRTHPGPIGEPASYIFGAAGDAGLTGVGDASYITNAVSNNPVFDTMTAQSAAEGWAWFSHLGDLHYRNINTNTPASFRTAYDDNFNFNLGFNPAARQGTFLRGQAITYIWDDHDYGGNDSNRTTASNPAANQVYRECVPHYPLGSGGSTGIYQSWQVGRVLYVATDSRSFRDPNSDPQGPTKTLLGTAQKAWFENLLTVAGDSGAEALVWQSSSRWIGGSDTWSSFENERDEMVQMFGDLGWLDRMLFMTADEHALSIGSGPYNPYGGFPMFMFASMDSAYVGNSTAIYDVGQSAGRQRYGTLRVTDNGHTISLTGTGYINGAVWKTYTKHVHVGSQPIMLDYRQGHISDPFEPTIDDQATRNIVTARREDGGEYTHAQVEGPKSVLEPPDGAGEYDDSVTLNVADDDQLPDQAAWRVHLGTVEEDRFPSITVDLRRNPELAAQLSGLNLGDRLVIENPPAELPPDAIAQIVEGGTTRLSLERWQAELNSTPAAPYSVAQLAAPQLLAAADAETSISSWFGFNAALSRVALPAVAPFAGAWSALVTPVGGNSSASANAPASPPGSIIPGEQYIVACWVYSPGGWADMKAAVDWLNASGGYLSTGGTSQVTAVPAGQWTLLCQTLTAPANASRAAVRSYAASTPGAANTWYTTRLTVREARATGYSAGPNRPNRMDTTSTQLVTAVSSGATELVAYTPPNGVFPRATWINSTGLRALFPTQFPFDVRLGGEVVRVTACAPATWDAFSRTTSNGWGTSSSGQVWAQTGGAAADFYTQGSEAAHSLGSVNVSRYSTITAPGPDLDLRVNVATSALAAGGSQYVHLVARYLDINNSYAARLAFTTSQQAQLSLQKRAAGVQTDMVTVTVPGPHTAFGFWTIRLQLHGSALRAKAWPRDQSEPERWQVTTTDTALTAAGSVGVRSVLDSANTNTLPVVASVDNFEITTPQRMTVIRSINTVVKPQAAGTAISLAQPAHVAL